jgi:hypothetical protein
MNPANAVAHVDAIVLVGVNQIAHNLSGDTLPKRRELPFWKNI